MSNFPDRLEQIAFYDRWNVNHRSKSFDEVPEEIRVRGLEVLRWIRSTQLRNPAILEVGCGTGWLSEKLAELGDVTAVDLSPAAIEVARRRTEAVRFIAGDFNDLEFAADQRFDFTVCMETLFYVADQAGLLKKMAGLTRHGGYVLLTTINTTVYRRSHDLPPPEPGQIRHWLRRRQLRSLVGQYFDIEHMYTVYPSGSGGFLRVVNSYKLNAVISRVLGKQRLRRWKELVGLGGGVIIVAKRRRNMDREKDGIYDDPATST